MTAPLRLEVLGEGGKTVCPDGLSQAVKLKPVANMGTHAITNR